LTAGDEIVAVENLEILRSNGFEVQIDEDQVPGRGERIKLSAMPVSKETTFDFKGKAKDSLLLVLILQTWNSYCICCLMVRDPLGKWSGVPKPDRCLR
jgi:hypothetical protein